LFGWEGKSGISLKTSARFCVLFSVLLCSRRLPLGEHYLPLVARLCRVPRHPVRVPPLPKQLNFVLLYGNLLALVITAVERLAARRHEVDLASHETLRLLA
jgi:hypothetical protein